MPGIERAITIAVTAHAGQCDKAGRPYILHPLRVMFRLKDETDMIVAVLHDVVEDTKEWPIERLRSEGFSDEILLALDGVTKRKGEDYDSFVARAATNPISRRVKLADLEDNLDVTRISSVGENEAKRLSKYLTARHHLLNLG